MKAWKFSRQRMTAERREAFLVRLRAGHSLLTAAADVSECAASPAGALATFVRQAERDERFALEVAEALVVGKEARAACEAQEGAKK